MSSKSSGRGKTARRNGNAETEEVKDEGAPEDGGDQEREEPQARVEIRFYKGHIEAQIDGFEKLGRSRLERGVRQVNREYHRERQKQIGLARRREERPSG